VARVDVTGQLGDGDHQERQAHEGELSLSDSKRNQERIGQYWESPFDPSSRHLGLRLELEKLPLDGTFVERFVII